MAISTALSSMASGITTRQALADNLAFLHMDLTDEELGRPAIEQSRSIRRHLAALVEEAVSQGSIRDVDADELADTIYTIYTIYNGALISWAIDGRGKACQMAHTTDRTGDRTVPRRLLTQRRALARFIESSGNRRVLAVSPAVSDRTSSQLTGEIY
jgi:hypothetical protein